MEVWLVGLSPWKKLESCSRKWVIEVGWIIRFPSDWSGRFLGFLRFLSFVCQIIERALIDRVHIMVTHFCFFGGLHFLSSPWSFSTDCPILVRGLSASGLVPLGYKVVEHLPQKVLPQYCTLQGGTSPTTWLLKMY